MRTWANTDWCGQALYHWHHWREGLPTPDLQGQSRVFWASKHECVVGFSKGQLVTGLFSWKHDVCYVWVWAGMGQKPLALVKKHSCLKWILVWVKIGAPIIRWLTLKIGKSLYCGTVPQVLKFDSPYGDGSIPIVTMRKFLHPAGPAIVWYYDTVHSMTRLTTHAVFSETGRPVQYDGHRNRRRLAAGYVPERDLEVGAGKDLHTVIGKQESSQKKQKMVNPQSWRFHYYPFLGTQNIAICYRRNLDIFVQKQPTKNLDALDGLDTSRSKAQKPHPGSFHCGIEMTQIS